MSSSEIVTRVPASTSREEDVKSESRNEKGEHRKRRILPTLFTKKTYIVLSGTGTLISLITVIFVALALKHETAGLLAVRVLDVAVFIFVCCFMVVMGILLYPLLVVQFRERILEQESFNALRKKFQEGNAELAEELAKSGVLVETVDDNIAQKISKELGGPSSHSWDMAWDKIGWAAAWDKVAAKHPDFAYLYTVVDQHFEAANEGSDERQTFEQKKQDYLRGLIRATATEHIEDTTFGIRSYELPVVFCMLSVAFGFFVFSLIPFLGITEIAFGSSSINLVWAAGGFTGAYLYSLYPLFQRYTRRDLPPRAFLDYAIKVFLGTMGVTVFGSLFPLEYGMEMQFAAAAVMGSVPFVLLNQARKQILSKLKWPWKLVTVGSKDASAISGITHEYSLRLHEEGIMNVQQLAFVNSEKLSERTMFNKETVCDWKNEAILRLLTGSISLDKTNQKPKEHETLYWALTQAGINTASDLSNFLRCEVETTSSEGSTETDENAAKLVKLLGWQENDEEHKLMLIKICSRAEKLMGEIEVSVATRAIKRELLND